jgi:hypothetical protein
MKKSASQLKIISYNGVNLVDGMVVTLILLDHIILILGYTDIQAKMFLLKLMNIIVFTEAHIKLMLVEEVKDSQVVN